MKRDDLSINQLKPYLNWGTSQRQSKNTQTDKLNKLQKQTPLIENYRRFYNIPRVLTNYSRFFKTFRPIKPEFKNYVDCYSRALSQQNKKRYQIQHPIGFRGRSQGYIYQLQNWQNAYIELLKKMVQDQIQLNLKIDKKIEEKVKNSLKKLRDEEEKKREEEKDFEKKATIAYIIVAILIGMIGGIGGVYYLYIK